MLSYYKKIVQDDMEDIFDREIPFEKLENKSVLITGATGMLATYIVYFLYYLNINKKKNIKIYALVRNSKKAEKIFNNLLKDKNFNIIEQDIEKEINISQKIDYIFHLASSANPKTILEDPVGIIKANTIGTINVFEFARLNNSKVFFSSTREIYGSIKEKEYISEEEMGILKCLERRACYPESKRIAETICNSYYLQYNIDYQIARIAHVYGPGMNIENDGRIMSDIMSDVINNKNIILKSDGSALRAFCYISDAIRGIFTIVLNGEKNSVYNLSNEEEEISIKELSELFIKLFPKKKLEVEYNIPNSNLEVYTNYKRNGLDNKKLYNLGWKIKIKLKEGIKKTILSFNDYE